MTSSEQWESAAFSLCRVCPCVTCQPPHGASSALSALSLGEEHGPRGASPPKEEQKQREREEPHGVVDVEDPIAAGTMKLHTQQ